MTTFGKQFAGRFMKNLTPTRLVVYGSPSPEVKQGLAALGPTYMQPVDGFSR